MCLHPELIIQRRILEAKVSAEKKDPKEGICEYAFNGCDGAKDGETFRRYCENDGEYCPSKFTRAMEETQ